MYMYKCIIIHLHVQYISQLSYKIYCIVHTIRAPANLTSMSVPPATIHEPQLISPTKIESVLNASVVASNNHRKRPRDLIMGNGG